MTINTKKYKDIISQVLVDDRENTRIEYALKEYAPFQPIVTHLDIGDYIFKSPEGLEVVFEYKTAEDFLTSIENNHLHNQVHQMVTNFDYTFVIIEADNLRDVMTQRYFATGLDMSLSQVNGAISTFTTNSTVLITQSQYQAFDLMMRIAGKIFLNKPLRYKYGKKTTNSALNYLSSVRGLNSKAEIICRELHLKTLSDLLNLTKEDLCSVTGIGEKTAEKIMRQIK